ncbi:MAG: hypothetical protein JO340_20115 [Acidobacteriaceae bacterium]|nr:hypothetical protein [Acidobacteriaceae bacterium]
MACFRLALAVLAAPLATYLAFAGSTTPNFSGTWQLDSAKSPAAEGRSITYTIQDASGKINFTRVIREKDGKEITSKFTCDTGGTQCEFDEDGRKAHVSLWYDGTALVILKTDGPKEDAVTQWKLELDPGGSTLKVDFQHIDPSEKTETLVFDKKG